MKKLIIMGILATFILTACANTPKETAKKPTENKVVVETKVETKPVATETKTEIKPVTTETKTIVVETVTETKPTVTEIKTEVKPEITETKTVITNTKTEIKPVVTETKTTTEVKAIVVPNYNELLPKDATKFFKENPSLIIIDVSSSFPKEHLNNAISFPIKDGSFDKAFKKWNKGKTYLICSDSDEYSNVASKKLADEGFKKVYKLKGTLKEWKEAKLPIIKIK